MSLTTTIQLKLDVTDTLTTDFSTATDVIALDLQDSLADGTGADQADLLFHEERTIAASGTYTYDFTGGETNKFGVSLTFARIKIMLVVADAANTNNVLVGGGASNFVNWVGDASDQVIVRPGGWKLLFAPDATAYAVTATTADALVFTNSAGGSGVTYKVVFIGASA